VECPKIARGLAFLLLAMGSVCAQEYGFRTFGTAEGLNNLAVRQVYQDRGGFIWVSTENGIFRYDGDRFESFGPAQGIPISSIAAFGDAPDGSLLAGGAFGLYRLQGNHFDKVPVSFKTISPSQGIASDGKGHTFLGTESGLVELESAAGRAEFAEHDFPQAAGTSGPGVDGVLVDGDVVWYGCGKELCRMDRDGTRVFGEESGLSNYRLMVVLKDREGNLWLRLRNTGVLVQPAGLTKFAKPAELVPATVIGRPNVDGDGRILLPTPDGLMIGEGKGWQKIDRSVGLRGAIYSVFEDRQHSLWIGLAGRGLAQWRGYHEWKSYSTASGLASDIVYEIQPQSDGTLWVGTEGGLLRGERGALGIEWKKVAGLDGFPVHSVRLGPDGDLWVGSEAHGAARLHPRTGALERFGEAQGLAGKSPYTLRFDHQQRLWAATEAGLFVASAPYQKFSRVAEVPANQIWAVAEGSDGSMWVGGADGLFVNANGRWRNFNHDNGLSNQEVLALGAAANGEVWVGYRFGGGIDRVTLKADGLAVAKGVQRPGSDGLVYFLVSDKSGRLWAGTERGVDMWNGSRWSHYDTSDGLAWNDCDLNGFAEESDGTVWIGTSGGLSQFKPRPNPPAEAPIEVIFTKLVMGGRDVSGQSDPSFNIHANSLIARYSALNISNDDRILFRYQLKGANSGWTETTQRELQFAELAPGAYQLEVEAQGEDGAWSEQKAEFGFKILTPWYASWWFFGLCGLTPMLIAGAVVRLRIRSGRRRERELQQLKAAHDEITNLAFFDPLTGLPNRRLLLDRLRQTLAASIRSKRKRALLFVDLDDFKTLNDTLGHHIGDLLLQEVARRIVASIRETDTVARLGGDEFVVLLQDLSELPEDAAAEAKSVAEKILATLHEPYMLDGRECRSSSSIGITVFGNPQDNTNEVLQQADIAMYQAKAAGRNTLHFFAPALQAAVNARAAMEEDLRQGNQDARFPALLSGASGWRRVDRSRGAVALEASAARIFAARRIHSIGRADGADPDLGGLGVGNRVQADRGVGSSEAYGPSDCGREHQREAIAEPVFRAKRFDDTGAHGSGSKKTEAGTDREYVRGRSRGRGRQDDGTQGSRVEILARRFWHGIFFAGLSAAFAAGPVEDRPGVCAGDCGRHEQRRDCSEHYFVEQSDGFVGDCRGRGNGRTARISGPAGLPFVPGLSGERSGAAGRVRIVVACASQERCPNSAVRLASPDFLKLPS